LYATTSLAKILNVALPSLSGEARAVVDVLACKNGLLPAAGDVATFVGLRTRHQVARTLRRASLPPLEELAGWTRLFYWVLQSEQTGRITARSGARVHIEPATCYRLVRRLWDNRGRTCGAAALPARFCGFRTIWKDIGMHELALRPYMQAAVRRTGSFVARAARAPAIEPLPRLRHASRGESWEHGCKSAATHSTSPSRPTGPAG